MLTPFVTFLASVAFASVTPAPTAWEKVGTKDGITVYKMEIPGSDVLAFRGDGLVEASIARVATVIFDTNRATEWVPDLEESRIVRWSGANEFIEYDHVGTPIVLKDRDFVSHVKMEVIPEKHQLIFRYSRPVNPAEVAETSYIRGDLLHTTFILTQQGEQTQIEGEIHCDPKGTVPKWLVNFFQKDWPVKTLNGLREQVAKKDVIDNARFAKMFEPGFRMRPEN